MRRTALVPAIALALTVVAAGCTPATPNAPSAAADASAAAAGTDALPTTQLPRNVRPTHYAIEVVPHADKLTFDGKVAIDIEVLEPTDRITLNALDMTFSKVQLTAAGGGAAPGEATTTIDAGAQTATFAFPSELPAGRYTLALEYTGKISTQANGLFAIDYDTEAGKKRALFTQFEAPDARRFVPSWDEPNYKATFDLTATVPADEMAVSNMPVAERTELDGGLAKVRFDTSPKMSTYLLFFSAGDFDRLTTTAEGVEIGVIAQAGKAEQARFALESSAEVLREYNDYFGTPYPLPKLDNLAAPGRSQFFSAMENWGAILTFEHTLLLDPSIASVGDRQRVFSVAAHEIAHQWFGNLVTMQWWDDLWLNEGFATWMAGRTTEKLHPEWNTRVYAVFGRDGAMGMDSVESTHPVVQEAGTVEQVMQAFDGITYQKGQAVIRMLEGYVGADAWREGVRSYMKEHAYGNTVSNDLWRAVQSASGKPIEDIAHDFTLQPGVPLITVASANCEGGNTTLVLEQGEFTRDRPGKKPLAWSVPVIAQVVGNKADARMVVENGKGTLEVPGCGPVVVNAGQTGYYRTLYKPAQFAQVREGFAKMDTLDQIGVLQDTWALGLGGLQPASDYLELAAALPVDADPMLWGEVAGSFASLDGYYAGDAARQAAFRAFAVETLKPVLARVGWAPQEGEDAPVKLLREGLIGTLGELGDAEVIAEARRRFAASETDAGAIPAELRRTILGVVALHADAATWDKLHAAAKSETTPLVKDMLYSLLSSTKDEALAKRALELALTDEPGATLSASMIGTVAGEHPDLAFDFAVAHAGELGDRIDASSRTRYYPGLANGSLDKAMIGKLNAYAEKNIPEPARRPVKSAVANIEYRLGVREQRLPEIDAWLKQQGS